MTLMRFLDLKFLREFAARCRNFKSTASVPRRIVRALARDRHIVHMAFTDAGAGDAHELGLGMEVLDRTGADITHGGTQSADELVQHALGRALSTEALLNVSAGSGSAVATFVVEKR